MLYAHSLNFYQSPPACPPNAADNCSLDIYFLQRNYLNFMSGIQWFNIHVYYKIFVLNLWYSLASIYL